MYVSLKTHTHIQVGDMFKGKTEQVQHKKQKQKTHSNNLFHSLKRNIYIRTLVYTLHTNMANHTTICFTLSCMYIVLKFHSFMTNQISISEPHAEMCDVCTNVLLPFMCERKELATLHNQYFLVRKECNSLIS